MSARAGSRGAGGLLPAGGGMGRLPGGASGTACGPDPREEPPGGKGAGRAGTQHSPCHAAACPVSASPSSPPHLYSRPHPLLAKDGE